MIYKATCHHCKGLIEYRPEEVATKLPVTMRLRCVKCNTPNHINLINQPTWTDEFFTVLKHQPDISLKEANRITNEVFKIPAHPRILDSLNTNVDQGVDKWEDDPDTIGEMIHWLKQLDHKKSVCVGCKTVVDFLACMNFSITATKGPKKTYLYTCKPKYEQT